MQNKTSNDSTNIDQIVFNNIDNDSLSRLCGPLDINIKTISHNTSTVIIRVGNTFKIKGENFLIAKKALCLFYKQAKKQELTEEEIHLGLKEINSSANYKENINDNQFLNNSFLLIDKVRPRTEQQYKYLDNILKNDINFGIGPAGTGKTMLAVACAVKLLNENMVKRLILTRPAVEAGEKLGFLPGDLTQKVDPYLRPLYDSLYEFMGIEKVQKLFDKRIIEIAPLAYMRGRTLNNSFVILDESQNTTQEQMKMFLTRIGLGSKAVITGDPSQIDLHKEQKSGLTHAISILNKIDGISITTFGKKDIMRHNLITQIVEAYETNT
ncbi:PhoH-like phosphate starvation-inducible protein [Candidatus Kinetoplastibacterium desouzaii TCC079E]|uniref:PhoH-like protein n=1 Tax=Candidatus Kinetoplastidibacterium desouzai TCC079E TaxID=1208919 RepID=M1L1N5_9PROT|nr:PhoH family protein [Candidatus Kinetoplastibacterium desouzaii]AGF46673.1 PhoH-like phosphate starvation-inducible protein [Candidatus Kinetoplastibacterium desouzaii TCC079E]